MGTIGASVIFILAALALTHYVDISINIWLSVLVGALGGIVIGLVNRILYRWKTRTEDCKFR